MTQKRNLSFHPSLAGATSDKDFFVRLDALMNVEWKVDFTVMGQMFCCGASNQCSLPKVTQVSKQFEEQKMALVEESLNFACEYFHHVATLDDLGLLQRQNPVAFEFYQKNSPRLFISSLNNANLVRQYQMINSEFNFRGVDDIKLNGAFLRNRENAENAFEAIVGLKMPFHTITAPLDVDPEVRRVLNEIEDYVNKCSFGDGPHIRYISEADLLQEEDGTSYEYWEEHTTYMVQNRFFLNKEESSHYHKFFYTSEGRPDPMKFLVGMLKRKIELYRENLSKMPEGRQKDYHGWVVNHAVVNEDFNFIPAIMMDRTTHYWQSLVCDGIMMETPMGLIRRGSLTDIIPLVGARE